MRVSAGIHLGEGKFPFFAILLQEIFWVSIFPPAVATTAPRRDSAHLTNQPTNHKRASTNDINRSTSRQELNLHVLMYPPLLFLTGLLLFGVTAVHIHHVLWHTRQGTTGSKGGTRVGMGHAQTCKQNNVAVTDAGDVTDVDVDAGY